MTFQVLPAHYFSKELARVLGGLMHRKRTMAARVGLSVQAIQGQQNNRVNLNIRKLYLHFVYFDLFDVSGEIGCELGNTNLLRTNW